LASDAIVHFAPGTYSWPETYTTVTATEGLANGVWVWRAVTAGTVVIDLPIGPILYGEFEFKEITFNYTGSGRFSNYSGSAVLRDCTFTNTVTGGNAFTWYRGIGYVVGATLNGNFDVGFVAAEGAYVYQMGTIVVSAGKTIGFGSYAIRGSTIEQSATWSVLGTRTTAASIDAGGTYFETASSGGTISIGRGSTYGPVTKPTLSVSGATTADIVTALGTLGLVTQTASEEEDKSGVDDDSVVVWHDKPETEEFIWNDMSLLSQLKGVPPRA
jgi:plastocyanin